MYSSSEDEGGLGRPRRELSSTGEIARSRRQMSDSESSDAGGGRSVRERVRGRSRRTPGGEATPSSGGSGSDTGAVPGSSLRARRLKQMREEERRKELSSSAGDEVNPDRGGQRSPVRGRLSRTQSTASNKDSEYDESDDDKEDEVEEKPFDEYIDSTALLMTMEPHHVYPLNLLPSTRAEENRIQPALTIPEGTQVHIPFVTKKLLSKPLTESNLMQGNATMLGTSEASETDRLISQNDGKLRGSSEELDDQTMVMLHAGDSRNSGLYVRESPVWARKLLGTNEAAAEALRDSVDPNMHLARVTQRTLRDLQGSLSDLQVREQWRKIENSQKAEESMGARRGRRAVEAAGGVEGEDDDQEVTLERSAAPSRLLRQVACGPVLRIIDDPIDTNAALVDVPDPKLALGGQLGNWGPDASIRERLGPLTSGHDRHHGSRSILRLHVHQISLQDFPLISEEESKFNEMKRIFAVYRSIFEHKTLPYLCARVAVLVQELKRLVNLKEELARDSQELDADEVILLKNLYYDLIESAPLLRDLRKSVDTLTANLHEAWRDIGDIRQRNGNVYGTKAVLVAKRIDHDMNDGSGFSEGKGGEGEEEASPGSWVALKSALKQMPEIITQAQAVLFESDLREVQSMSSGSKSAGDLAEEVAKHISDNRKPARPDRKRGEASAAGGEGDGSVKVRSQSGRAVTPLGSQAEAIRTKYSKTKAALATVGSDLSAIKTLVPDYVLKLTEDGEITPEAQLDVKELDRRKTLEASEFKCVVKINDKVVTESKTAKANLQSLTVDIMQYFEFRVLHQPDSIVVDVYVTTPSSTVFMPFGTTVLVQSIGIPFPGQSTGATGGGGSGYSKKISPSAHMFAPIAGWLSFTSPCPLFGNLLSTGTSSSAALLCATEYDLVSSDHKHGEESQRFSGVDEANLALLPPRSEQNGGNKWGTRFTMGGGLSSAQLLPSLMTMDPNDPRNAMLSGSRFDAMQTVESRKLFHMFGNDVAEPFREGQDSYRNYLRFKMGPRLQLLQLRENKPHLFSEPIPNTDEAIRQSTLYKQILYQNFKDPSIQGDNEENKQAALGAGEKVKNFLSRVRNSNIAQQRSRTKKKMVTSSAVAEQVYFERPDQPDLSDLIPAKKRSLKPTTKPRSAMSMHVDKCNVLVQVVGARNIPLRSLKGDSEGNARGPMSAKKSRKSRSSSRGRGAGGESDGGSSGESGGEETLQVDEALLDETKVNMRKRAQTCVEVKFQENREATVCVAGRAPLWKQSIGLPFRAPGDDYSPSALAQVRDDMYFTLFDVVEEDDSFRGGAVVGQSTLRTERRYLGSFTLPFSTIYNLGRVEGSFRLYTPIFNFGYSRAGYITEDKERGASENMFGNSAGEEQEVQVRDTSLFEKVLLAVGLMQPEKRLVQEFGQFVHPKTAEELEYFASGDGSTYIKILATLDPLLATIPSMPGDVAISSLYHDDRTYGPYAQAWLRGLTDYSPRTKERGFKCFGMNSEGLQVLICRYLSPLKPPEGFTTIRSVIHLVSMFPYLSDAQSFQESDIDFWCTTKQAWDVGAGDEEEHATMLYNYLYYLALSGDLLGSSSDKRGRRQQSTESLRNRKGGYPDDAAIRDESVFLVLGEAHPEGDAVYVMVRDLNMASSNPHAPRNFILINPVNGNVYSAMDPSCPLRNIFCLATPYNIWGNVQNCDKPHELSFDVLNIDMWRPFFGKRLSPPNGGVHAIQDEVLYTPTSPQYALDVETTVQGAIRSSMRRWRSKRSRSTTTFHPDGCSIMTEILPMLELWRKSGSIGNTNAADDTDVDLLLEEAEKRMAPILRTRSFHGCPINFSFTDVDDILNKIKALCVHETNHPEVQFVLAVRAFPLFNNTVSLWVFLGTLEASGI